MPDVPFLPKNVAVDELAETLMQLPLHSAIRDNIRLFNEIFRDCTDLVVHGIKVKQGKSAAILYIDGLVQKSLVDRDIVAPLISGEVMGNLAEIASGRTSMSEARILASAGEVADRILGGEAVLLVDGMPQALAYGVRGWESRAVAEPVTESTIRGPREGFVETLRFNTALLRRKIKSPALKVISRKIGRITQTDVAVAFVEGLANPEVVQEVFRRLDRIDVDGVLEGGYLEEFIEDSPFSPFPQVQNTERPDIVAGNLLEGRVAIFVDGTPFVLIVPVVFIQFMQASEDYYERFIIGTVVRGLRYLFLAVALLLPSIYISIVTFHMEMLPQSLLLSIQYAREGIPFPAVVEALLMEIIFEILREAGIRLPRPVGQAVSIVGALVIGDAAVSAGLASASMVIVVSVTGIASFAIPRYNAGIAIRMLRFPLMFLAGSLGAFGIAFGLGAILIHLCSLRSFGIPYLFPVAPANWSGLKDAYMRPPHWWRRLRPRLLGHANPVRTGKHLRPGPNQGTNQGTGRGT